MTTLTFGSGGTYSTLAAAVAALPATFTDDYEVVQVGNAVETSDYTAPIVDLAGYDLTFRNSSPHGGDPTVGYKLTATVKAAGLRIQCNDSVGGSTVEVKELHWQWNTTMPGGGGGVHCVSVVPGVGGVTAKVHDLIITNQVASTGTGILLSAGTGNTVEAWNIATYQWTTGIDVFGGSGVTYDIENVTVINSTFALTLLAASGITVRNSEASSFTGIYNIVGYNNASVDASAADGNWSTGSGNVTGITLANEFVSLAPTNTAFAKVKTGGSCDDGGTTTSISGNTAGIRGNARPGTDSQYSIGSDEFLLISTVTVTSCNPNDGAAAGGTPVTVGGTGFVATPTVTFGGVPATSVVWVSATELTCVTPPGNGVVDIVVTNPDTGFGTLAGGFSYIGVYEAGAKTPITVPVRLGEGDAGIFRSSPGLEDVLNKIAVCLQFMKLASQQDSFAEFKTAMEDLVAPTYSARPRYVTPYSAPDPEPITVPRRTGEGRVGLNRAQTSEYLVGLKDVLDRIALMIQEIQSASQLADFAAFKTAMANVPALNKSSDSRI